MKITFPHIHGTGEIYMDCLRAICGRTDGGKSMIDLCCAHAPHTPLLGFKDRLYVDILPRQLVHPEEQKYFIQQDVLTLGDSIQSVDQPNVFVEKFWCSICSDGIEHLSKEDGYRLISWMEKHSFKQVLFTPLDPWSMAEDGNNDPEAHRSVWSPDDFIKNGWATIVFPEYHPTLEIGAFFAYKVEGDQTLHEHERVINELMDKRWALGQIFLGDYKYDPNQSRRLYNLMNNKE